MLYHNTTIDTYNITNTLSNDKNKKKSFVSESKESFDHIKNKNKEKPTKPGKKMQPHAQTQQF